MTRNRSNPDRDPCNACGTTTEYVHKTGVCSACDVQQTRERCHAAEGYESKSGRIFGFTPTPGNPDAARLLVALLACDGRTAKIPARFKKSK